MANLSAPSATWQNRSPGASAALGILILDADGDWAVTDEPGATPVGTFALDAGELVIDDATSGGLTALRYGSDTLVVL